MSSPKPRQKCSFAYDMKSIRVENIATRTSLKALESFFGGLGKVKHCQMVLSSEGIPSGCAVISFCHKHSAELALATGTKLVLHGRTLLVSCIHKRGFETVGIVEEEELHEAGTRDTETLKGVITPLPDADFMDTPIDRLPEEIIAYIFEFLDLKKRLLAEKVCKRWREVSMSHWSSIKQLNIYGHAGSLKAFRDHHLEMLLSRGSCSLISITLSSPVLTGHSLEIIGQHCKLLQVLELKFKTFSEKELRTLADGCQHLRSVTIDHCYEGAVDKRLRWLFQGCKKLQHIDLTGSWDLEGKCFSDIGSDVLHLNVGFCLSLKDFGIQKIGAACHNIKELSISNCKRLTDVSLKVIGQCSTITSLDVSNLGDDVTMSGLMELCHLTNLEILIAANCGVVDDNFIVALSKACRQLRKLDINAKIMRGEVVTDSGVESVSVNCSLLSSMDVSARLMVLNVFHISEMFFQVFYNYHTTDYGRY